MGDDLPVELDLELGIVIGADNDRRLAQHDEYYDVAVKEEEDNADNVCMPIKKEEEDETDEEQFFRPMDVHNNIKTKKEEDDSTDNEEGKNDMNMMYKQQQPPQSDGKVYQPPSLLQLTTQMVSSNIEKYPPGALGVLSEYHWENVINARVNAKKKNDHNSSTSSSRREYFDPRSASAADMDDTTANNKEPSDRPLIALEGHASKRLLPEISEKILIPIEQHPNNVHLSKSKVADELLWKSIVDYNFHGTMTRPKSLEVPCDVLKERLNEWGDELLEIVRPVLTEEEYAVNQAAKGESMFYDCDILGDGIERTNNLKKISYSLSLTPMDVKLLAATDIGKKITQAVKVMKKVWKENKKKYDNIEDMEYALKGYPQFWKLVSWDDESIKNYIVINDPTSEEEQTLLSPLGFLQQILQDWKDMVSDNDIADASKSTTSSPQCSETVATCGRGKKVSTNQHQIDMQLLHESPDWRSLYQSLRKREEIMKKSHGDRVRSIRDNLKKDRPKVGKVVLKKAVGRVRGGDTDCSSTLKEPFESDASAAVTQSLKGSLVSTLARRTEKREAILSKSLGHRARQQQFARNPSSHSSSGKLKQIRSESRVAAARSKSSHASASGIKSSFGASIARAGGTSSGRVKMQPQQGQVHVKLKHGKSMKLPSSALVWAAQPGVVSAPQQKKASQGIFSSLEQKKRKRTGEGKFNAQSRRKKR